jgi:hypothetical protein
MSSPATSSDVTNAVTQAAILRQYDDLMASQCQQTADINGQGSLHFQALSAQGNDAQIRQADSQCAQTATLAGIASNT